MSGGWLWMLPFSLQGLAMTWDEFHWHRRRTVPRWERLGHALDTSVFLACLLCPLLLPPTLASLGLFGALAILSCLLITKDEWVHQRECPAGEHWVHAVLFILHPLVLVTTAWLWLGAGTALPQVLPGPHQRWVPGLLRAQGGIVAGFLVFQVLDALLRKAPEEGVDNAIYEDLGERWYTATDDPVALLRAEARLRTAWVLAELREHFGARPLSLLDVGCGGGFLANPLALAGHAVTGIDLAPGALEVARRHDVTGSVGYLAMDARKLAFPDACFDGVCMMDFLEHLEEREAVIEEAARVLKPGGWFFFHTFNRTPLSWLIAIKGVAWFVKNTPRNLHVYHLFLQPSELRALCDRHHLVTEKVLGLRPRVCSWAFLRLLGTGRVSDGFQFTFTRHQGVGYCGRARKTGG